MVNVLTFTHFFDPGSTFKYGYGLDLRSKLKKIACHIIVTV